MEGGVEEDTSRSSKKKTMLDRAFYVMTDAFPSLHVSGTGIYEYEVPFWASRY
jgi:hypothetical protein